jgi:DNA ligase (NAD+)
MITTRIKELEDLILYHKEKYYSGMAEISDESYDAIEEELRRIDPQNPILQFVGFKVDEKSAKIQHDRKMLSLEKTYSQEDLCKWINDKAVLSIFKIDGSSCSLIYEDGHLKMAKTRGDGSIGENITKKAFFIKDIPKTIEQKSKLEIRGEVYCVETEFIHLTNEMKRMNLEPPSSQRNIVAGILGRKENIQLAKFLSFKAFDIISNEKLKFEHEKLELLKRLNFPIPEYEIHKDKKSIDERIAQAKSFINDGEYLVDGLVLVYDDLRIHEELGETSHHPRYKIAFKFAGETKVAKITAIEWNVSRNGLLTPVAQIEETELSGAMISRVTLHNFGLVKNFELRPGDRIEIIRSGEVIPKFLGVIEKSRGEFIYPHICPSCGQKVIEEDIWLVCKNDECSAKIKEQVLNYIHKSGMEDVSDKRLEEMMTKGLVKKISDLYKLEIEDLLTLEKVKDKLARKIYENIQKTKKIDLLTFITSLGIEGLSFAKSEKVISHGHNNLEKFMGLTLEQLVSIEGFAEKSATEILKSIKGKVSLVKELLNLGVVVESGALVAGDGRLSGKKLCITGELSVSRSVIEKKIKENGGIIVSSVSKNTNYLVTNETESSSSKFTKAKTLGIPIISEEEMNKIIEG